MTDTGHRSLLRIRELEAVNAEIVRHRDKLAAALVEIVDLSLDEPGGLNFASRASKIARGALGWEQS